MKNTLIDFLGNEVVVGDEVVAMVRRGERSKELVRGLVVDITPKRVKVYTGYTSIEDIVLEDVRDYQVRNIEHSRCIKLVKNVCVY